MDIHPIAHMRGDFSEKFGIPRQSGLVEELTSTVVFVPEDRKSTRLNSSHRIETRVEGWGG